MKKDCLIVVDMQNDFVNGSLGSEDAIKIVPNVLEKVYSFAGEVIFTRDTHQLNYMDTQEGSLLPVEHCIEGSQGWNLINGLDEYRINNSCMVFDKCTFGSVELAKYIKDLYDSDLLNSITVIGLCTDICVVSNALLIKAFCPELCIKLDEKCCAGVTKEKHDAAVDTMKSCQIIVDEI